MTNGRPLVQTIALGPPSALEKPAVFQAPSLRELFAMHAPYVWNTLRRLGAPTSDLEDLTHDVFLQVNRHLGDYDHTRPIRPWLFCFAYRVASQHRRRARRRPETSLEPELVAHPAAGPEEVAVAEQRRQMVIEALQGIDLQRRAVFVLYELDGVAMSEIARILEIPPNTAYSRLRVAREEFRAAVKRAQARGRHP